MTLTEVYTMLTGIQGFASSVSYYNFPQDESPDLPYIVYLETGENPFAADGVRYYASKQVQIELYTEKRDTQKEALIESTLTGNGLFYTKETGYLDDEQMQMTVYRIEV